MPLILWRYITRETLVPTLLALLGLTFMMLTTVEVPGGRDENLILLVMRLSFQEAIDKGALFLTLLMFVPSVLAFITPMAFLIGIIIGIGRLTLDLEIRAMQTAGIRLARVFAPILGLGALLTFVALVFSYEIEPRLARASIERVGKLLVSEFSNLEPGKVYDELFGSDMNLYFEDRDEESGVMKNVTLLLDQRSFESEQEERERKRERREAELLLKDQLREGRITAEEYERGMYQLKVQQKSERPILVFAREAGFNVDIAESLVELNLFRGSIHLLQEPETAAVEIVPVKGRQGSVIPGQGGPLIERDYAIIRFGKMTKTESVEGAAGELNEQAMTTNELREAYRDYDLKDQKRMRARAVILQRYSIAFQYFVFAFLGLPLAVWVRPTGKSVGIVMAFLLILIYQWLLHTGFTLVETEQPLGALMIFSPNLLFLAIGSALWVRMNRR